MKSQVPFDIVHRLPTVAEFQLLRRSTGWDELEDHAVAKGLSNTLFCVCAVAEGKIAGMGRIVGDGAVYFYIQDVIVLPEFKGNGIGMAVMNELEKFLKLNASHNAFIGLMAAKGVKEFYRSFQYRERDPDGPGMFKIMDRHQ